MRKLFLLLTLLLCLTQSPAFAQDEWVQLGLDYEHVLDILVHPSNDSIIFAGAQNDFMNPETIGGIFKSTDEGATWDTLVTGGISVSCLAMHPMDHDIIYAGLNGANSCLPGIIKTTNGGKDWVWSHDGIYVDWETYVNTVAINPLHPDTLFAGTGGAYGGELYRSINGGDSWTEITGQIWDSNMGHIAIDPVNPWNVYVCVRGEGTVFKSTNGGNYWQELNLPPLIPKCIVIDPFDPNIIYLGATSPEYTGQLYRSTNAGFTWVYTDFEIEQSGISKVVIHPINTDWVFMSTAIGFVISPDGGGTWDVFNEGLPRDTLTSLACNSAGTTFYGWCPANYIETIYRRYFTMVSIEDESINDCSIVLHQNYPNPFNESTVINFQLPTPQIVNLGIYNSVGQLVKLLVNSQLSLGQHELTWNGIDQYGQPVASGVYFYQIKTIDRIETRSMVLLRE